MPSDLRRRTLLFVFLTVFLDLLGAGILIPIIPYLVRQFRTDAMTVGLLSVAFSGAQFFAAPVLGVLSDRIGRRPVLVFSIFGSAAGYFLFGWAGSLWLMFLARVVDGITGGNISTAMAAIADISEPEERAKNFGLIGMAFGLGFIIGPVAGGLLSKISLQAPAYGAAVIATMTGVFGYFALPETLPEGKRRQGGVSWVDLSPFRPIFAALERPQMRLLLASLFFLNFAFTALQTNFSNFTMDRFQFTAEQNAWVFAFIGLLVAIMQGGVVRRLLPIFGETKLAFAGFVLFLAGFVGIAAAWLPVWIYPGVAMVAIGSAFTNPTLNAMISRRAGAHEQGTILGTTQSVLSLTRVFGPAWAGLVFDHFGSGAPYWTGAAFIVVALTLVMPVLRESPSAA